MATQNATARADASPSTSYDRLTIRTLLADLDLDTVRATLYHERIWKAAEIPAPPLGVDLDTFLRSLTRAQIRRVAAAMKAEVSHA